MMAIRIVSILLLFLLIIFPTSLIPAQTSPPSGSDAKGIITGKILMKGGSPLDGGSVWLYDAITGPPPFGNQLKRTPSLRIETNPDGTFREELVPGKYYLRAVKRMSPEKPGLREGDYVYYGINKNGDPKIYDVKSGEILDIGVITEMVPYKKSNGVVRTAIEGMIRDSQGNPVEGVIVFAFRDLTRESRPLYFSDRTGPDGKYILSVTEGTYYLRARNKLKGGIPERGQLLGAYGGETPVPVAVKDGEIVKAIDITVITFPGRGRESRAGSISGLPQLQLPQY